MADACFDGAVVTLKSNQPKQMLVRNLIYPVQRVYFSSTLIVNIFLLNEHTCFTQQQPMPLT